MAQVSAMKFVKKVYTESITCPECGSRNLIYDRNSGEYVCGDCGLVVQDFMLDRGPEWRSFTPEEKISRSRVGIPTSYTMHDKGLSTTIEDKYDMHGRKLSAKKRYKARRLKRLQNRVSLQDTKTRNLIRASREISRISNSLQLPYSTREKGMVIYRKALDEGLIRGRSIECVAAASLYVACRIEGIPRSIEEFSSTSSLKKKQIARNYRILLRKLEIRVPNADSKNYITKIANKLNLPVNVQILAAKILKYAKEKGISAGKNPIGLTAAALYSASKKCNFKITQHKLSLASNVTEVTIRNRYKELENGLDLDMLIQDEELYR